MNDSAKKGWLPIAGLIALIVVPVLGIKLIFAGLGTVIQQEPGAAQSAGAGQTSSAVTSSGSVSAGTEENAPAFCPFCGKGLNGSFQWGQYCPYCGEKVEQ